MVRSGVSEYNELCEEIFHRRANMVLLHAIAFTYLALAALVLTYTIVGDAGGVIAIGDPPQGWYAQSHILDESSLE